MIINTIASIRLKKYSLMFVLGHYLFLEDHSFRRNCSLLGTDNVCGQMSVHIFAPNGGFCLYSLHLNAQKSKSVEVNLGNLNDREEFCPVDLE